MVTVHVDASFKDPAWGDNPGAAWAMWARTDDARIIRSGICPEWATNSSLAEFAAIFAGVWVGANFARGGRLLVKSDCKLAIGWMTGKRWDRRKLPPAARPAQARAISKVRDLGIDLRVKYTPAHTRGDTAAGYVNNRVDAMAKEARVSGKGFCRVFRLAA